jgi:hypothetical protein
MKRITKLLAAMLLLLLAGITAKAQYGVGFTSYAIGGTVFTNLDPGTNWAIIPAELASQMYNSEGIPVSPIPIVNYLQSRNSLSTGVTLQSYYSTNQTYFSGAGLTGELTTNQVPWPNGTNGFAAGSWCVISHGPITNYVSVTNVIYGQTNIVTKAGSVTRLPLQINDEAVYIAAVPATINIITNTLSTITNASGSITTNTYTVTNSYIAFSTTPLETVNQNDVLYQETPGASIIVPGQALTVEYPATGLVYLSGQRQKPFLITQISATANTNYIDTINAQMVP